ncbi:metallophosphoesterase family protein [Deinococcus peraridilitoris]|uniref:Putative phosphoesterase n=1 Tax=Deinococcus peraridilitoris (strain DSM 19664 / LMG 22246 / CIP 109416 / KR-200) TaxID=937777 RepID=L0A7J8_DEIPD|nr:metallophosphoesterase family protein [Deinococcus peraridilitoris]AFZ69137.1 putative phosphoesterase [Deinococcus peraridilitoris DSM 19664]
MRLAFLSDIHGNIHALSAVQRFLDEQKVESVFILGDLVGYGASPGPVIDLVQRAGWVTALGSSDARAAFDFAARGERGGVAEQTLAWTRTMLTDEQMEFLRRLPAGGRIMTKMGRVRYFHGSPHDPDSRIDLMADDRELQGVLENLGAKVVVCGGTHVPYFRKVDGGIFIDPGSVGLSLNHEPGADVALLEITNKDVSVKLHKVPYDVHAAAFDIVAWNLPPVIAEVIRSGHMAS